MLHPGARVLLLLLLLVLLPLLLCPLLRPRGQACWGLLLGVGRWGGLRAVGGAWMARHPLRWAGAEAGQPGLLADLLPWPPAA